MTDPFTQVGIGGIFAILVLREVFTFLKGKNGHGADGQRELVRQVVKAELAPIEEHLRKIREYEHTIINHLTPLPFVFETILKRDGH